MNEIRNGPKGITEQINTQAIEGDRMARKNLVVTKKVNELSQHELMELICCLNNNMVNYDSNISRAMERSNRAEWDSLKNNRSKWVNIQYAESKK